jgi:hypothetical protein
MKLNKRTLLVAIGLFFLNFSSVNAADQTPTPVPMKVTKAYSIDHIPPGLRDRLIVEVEKLSEAIEKDKINPRDFVLYLDGRPLEGINASPIQSQEDKTVKLQFELQRTEKSRAAWTALLGSPTSVAKWIRVSVGLPNQPALPSDAQISLRVLHRWWLVLASILLLLALIFFVWLAKRGWLIHDSNPPAPPPGKLKPYSLALTQAAFWFFLVIGSFILIYMITGEYNTITDQALVLIGIGTGTALGAAMIDQTKTDTSTKDLSGLRPEKVKLAALGTELAKKEADLKAKIQAAGANATADDTTALQETSIALQENDAKLKEVERSIADAQSRLENPVSQNFVMDLLTDANGITLHRFQIVIWTLILGCLFVYGVYRDLAMPEFSTTLLALMGISSGTYLGFKIPERQN